METFSALLAICAGTSPVPVNSPHKGQWRGALMFSLIPAWINGWANNREAGDFRRNRAHYDVIVIISRTMTDGSVSSLGLDESNSPTIPNYPRASKSIFTSSLFDFGLIMWSPYIWFRPIYLLLCFIIYISRVLRRSNVLFRHYLYCFNAKRTS